MTVNSGHRYKILASIVAVVVMSLFFAIYKYSGSPEPLVDRLVVDQPKQRVEASEEPLPTALSGKHPVIGDDSLAEQLTYESEPHVSIDVSDAEVLLVAVEAALQEVLDGLVNKALVEVVDLRLEDAPVADDARSEKQSFRFSGSVDDVLRFVMKQYNHSYVISHVSPAGTQVDTPVVKLFLYETMQAEDTKIADEQHLSPVGSETISATDYPESEGNSGIVRESGTAKKRVNVANVLRNRASFRGNLPVYSYSAGAGNRIIQQRRLSGRSSSARNIQVSGTFDDKAMRSSLADMTRRASEEVKALAMGLKEAENSLAAQRNNGYGEVGQ